ncbi:hypothetical protein Hanom_Chr15g01378421 [Helianthus anomalus]
MCHLSAWEAPAIKQETQATQVGIPRRKPRRRRHMRRIRWRRHMRRIRFVGHG